MGVLMLGDQVNVVVGGYGSGSGGDSGRGMY